MRCFCSCKKASSFLCTFDFSWGAAWSGEFSGDVETLKDVGLLVVVVVLVMGFSSGILMGVLAAQLS